MSDSQNSPEPIASVIKGVVENTPVYEDAVQSGAKQIGEALNTAGALVNLVLRPVNTLVETGNHYMDKLDGWLRERLKGHESGKIHTPDPFITGAVVPFLPYAADVKELRDMYVNLLGAAMHDDFREMAHPGFGEAIRQMTPQEAYLLRILSTQTAFPILEIQAKIVGEEGFRSAKKFCFLENPPIFSSASSRVVAYRNLERLGFVELTTGSWLTNDDEYALLRENDEVCAYRAICDVEGKTVANESRGLARLTEYGHAFVGSSGFRVGNIRFS